MSVTLCGVVKRFGRREVLRGVDLTVAAGECIGVQGASGSGKTTILRLIAGLERPDAGAIEIAGAAAAGSSTFAPPHARRVGLVFQDLALWPHLTAMQHLSLVAQPLRLGRRERRERVAAWLERCHLTGVARQRPDELSGGERQRLALARTLLPGPRVLLLDEPFTGLDPALLAEMKSLVGTLHREQELTTLIVSHDPRDFEGLAIRVVQMAEGRLSL